MFWRFSFVLLLTACSPGTTYKLNEANDYFKFAGNTDQYFTQGIQLSAETPDSSGRHSYLARHLFYTPADKRSEGPVKGDRPYAGYLGGGYRAEYEGDIYGIELGVVGPAAHGKEVQREFHKVLGQGYPQGWDNQIKNEPTILLTYEHREKIYESESSDVTSFTGANLGNLFTQSYQGFGYRYGHNLDDNGITDPIFPRLRRQTFAYWFEGLLLTRAVAWNIFLDGNSYQRSAYVDKEPVVTEGRVGFTVKYKDYSFTYLYIKQSKEFSGEITPASFGNLIIGVSW